MDKRVKHIHLIGIGGAGMSGIAEVLHNLGYTVSGSDLHDSEVTRRLKRMGIGVRKGHQARHLKGADAVVYSSAVRETNVELARAREAKLPVIRRADMLGELMRIKYGIGVAGTHGKTTTTSMVGAVLTEGRLDPTVVVGGRMVATGTGAQLGKGHYMVVEADEFDRSFLRLMPVVAVITTLEAEHLDCYRDLDDIKTAFVEYANHVPFFGSVVLCLDEPSVQDIIPRIERHITTYGFSPQAQVRAENVSFKHSTSSFTVLAENQRLGTVSLRVPGIHNIKNALAAIAVGRELEIPFGRIKKALQGFAGVRRRFEIKGERNGVLVVDDYAHHPTEIEVTLQAARKGWEERRIIAVFQPHLYSRTRDFGELFARAFFKADLLVVSEIFAAREDPIAGVSGRLIADKAKEFGHQEVHFIPRPAAILSFLKKATAKNDMLITLGAGDIWKVGESFLRNR